MKLIPARDVIKPKKDDKRNTKKRFLVTDGICFRCGAIINYSWESACILCCGSNEFLVGEPSKVLRELLELDIEQILYMCQVRDRNISSGSRAKMTLALFRLIFPKLSSRDDRINEFFVRKIIYRNRRRLWYLADIESEIFKIRKKVNIKLVDTKDII